jgi:chemotaxis response regulator CheB
MKTLTLLHYRNELLVIALSLLLIPAWSQNKQLAYETPSTVALVDHSRIRNEYKGYCTAKEKMTNARAAKKKALDHSLSELEKQKTIVLKADAKKGGKNRQHIINKFETQKAKVKSNYNKEQKEINDNCKAQMRAYDNKVNAVITILMSQGGFSELRSFKTGEKLNGVDITSMVLEKLK